MTIATNLLASPDVFSMTDEALAKMYQFSEEVRTTFFMARTNLVLNDSKPF